MIEFLKFGLSSLHGFWFAVFVFASVLGFIFYKDHQERLARLRDDEEKAILEMEEQNFAHKIKGAALNVNREVFCWHRKCDNFVGGNISTFRLINFAITNARGFDYDHCITEIRCRDKEEKHAFYQQRRYWAGMQDQQSGFDGNAYGGIGNPFGFR